MYEFRTPNGDVSNNQFPSYAEAVACLRLGRILRPTKCVGTVIVQRCEQCGVWTEVVAEGFRKCELCTRAI